MEHAHSARNRKNVENSTSVGSFSDAALITQPAHALFSATLRVFYKRLTLMKRHTQLSTHDMRTMTLHNPPLTNVTIDVTTDPQTNGATVNQ